MHHLLDFRLGLYTPDHFPLLFAISVLVSAGVVCFYAKRHPNPHFRPGKREVCMVSLLLLMASGGGCWVVANMLESNIDPVKFERQLESAQKQAFIKRGSERGADFANPSGASAPSEVPEDLPEEMRGAVIPK